MEGIAGIYVPDLKMWAPAQQACELSAYLQELAVLLRGDSQREERAPGDRR